MAFTPSFAFILFGAGHFDRLRGNPNVRAFLDGAGPAAVGAILGSAVPLALGLTALWQYLVLVGASVLLLALRRGVVTTLLTAAAAGPVLALLGGSLSRADRLHMAAAMMNPAAVPSSAVVLQRPSGNRSAATAPDLCRGHSRRGCSAALGCKWPIQRSRPGEYQVQYAVKPVVHPSMVRW